MNTDREYMIFKNEYGKYSIGLSKKNQNGEWENTTFPVRFQKEIELENKTKIKIQEYWFDFYNWVHESKKGTSYYFFINKFEVVDKKEESDPFKDFGEQIQLEDSEELPF